MRQVVTVDTLRSANLDSVSRGDCPGHGRDTPVRDLLSVRHPINSRHEDNHP